MICPLVEESDKIEATAAVEEHERLQAEIFPEFKLGLVHGKMPASEKEVWSRPRLLRWGWMCPTAR
ncbi:MAG: hypothetical protein IPL28_24245 [Chloroflexi bacterium]|nr:hypothetical protein [Chloroflexota bacterium]